jgi:hypothetical protein
MLEQRRSPRFLIDRSAIMRVQGRPGPFLVTILDVSASGLRVSSPSEFKAGTRVTIKCRGTEVKGEIRYARAVEPGECHVGILAEALADGGEVDLVRLLGPGLEQVS